jgi:hypothetical protein
MQAGMFTPGIKMAHEFCIELADHKVRWQS